MLALLVHPEADAYPAVADWRPPSLLLPPPWLYLRGVHLQWVLASPAFSPASIQSLHAGGLWLLPGTGACKP